MTHKFAMESIFYRLPCIGERLVHGLKLDSTLLDGILFILIKYADGFDKLRHNKILLV